MLRALRGLLGSDSELGWVRFKDVCARRAELRLPTVYERLKFSELKDSQAKKVQRSFGTCVIVLHSLVDVLFIMHNVLV